ncbi:MAG: nitroreductase family protein [Paludibacteraceae bacterium]|jgi:nitroreductase|nr:nitroreductase family protein [Prevotellaceae bacterium]
MLTSLNNRRTIRKYQQKEVDNQTLTQLLETAFRASTTGNMQLYSVVVTKDAKMKEQLAPTHFNQPTFVNAPVALTFCADYNRFVKWCEQREAEPGYDNFLSFLNAAIDTMLVAQTFCVAAEGQGLGICYLGTTTYNARAIAKILDLPKLVVPITTITVGYPAEDPEQTDRLPADSLIHFEKYKDYTPADIDRIYANKENLKESKKFIAENNKKTLAQVYTDIRYKKADNEAFSQSMLDFLKEQGFMK